MHKTSSAYFYSREHVGGLEAKGAQENHWCRICGVESFHEVNGGHHG